jgi:hypothetical protein
VAGIPRQPRRRTRKPGGVKNKSRLAAERSMLLHRFFSHCGDRFLALGGAYIALAIFVNANIGLENNGVMLAPWVPAQKNYCCA